jgi:hypothetical protein
MPSLQLGHVRHHDEDAVSTIILDERFQGDQGVTPPKDLKFRLARLPPQLSPTWKLEQLI